MNEGTLPLHPHEPTRTQANSTRERKKSEKRRRDKIMFTSEMIINCDIVSSFVLVRLFFISSKPSTPPSLFSSLNKMTSTTMATVATLQQVETFIRLSQRKLIIDKVADKHLIRAVVSRNALILSIKTKKTLVLEAMRREQEEEEEENRETADTVMMMMDEEEIDNVSNINNKENLLPHTAQASMAQAAIAIATSTTTTGKVQESEEEMQGMEEEVMSHGSVLSVTLTSPLRDSASPVIASLHLDHDDDEDRKVVVERSASCSPSPYLRQSLSAPAPALLPFPANKLKRCYSEGDSQQQQQQQQQQRQTKKARTHHHQQHQHSHPHRLDAPLDPLVLVCQ